MVNFYSLKLGDDSEMWKCFVFLFILSLNYSRVSALSDEDLSKLSGIIEKINRFLTNHSKISGDFEMKMNGQVSRGIFFMGGNSSFKLFFGPREKYDVYTGNYRIVSSNGYVVWIYLPNRKILVEQKVPEYFKVAEGFTSTFSNYFASYDKVSIREVKEKKNATLTILTFQLPNRETLFDTVSIEVTQEGFVRSVLGVSIKDGKQSSFFIKKTNVKKDVNFDNDFFLVKSTGDVQILRNVLIGVD